MKRRGTADPARIRTGGFSAREILRGFMPLIVGSPGAEAIFTDEGAIGFSQDIDIVPK